MYTHVHICIYKATQWARAWNEVWWFLGWAGVACRDICGFPKRGVKRDDTQLDTHERVGGGGCVVVAVTRARSRIKYAKCVARYGQLFVAANARGLAGGVYFDAQCCISISANILLRVVVEEVHMCRGAGWNKWDLWSNWFKCLEHDSVLVF